ncbi:MAG TPA: YkgJ family cysteine cluster protein, partial [Oligoflexia bacterium]|nr:YkgJ family cysteine cluster protein [Oligoflexia bacterium]
MANEKNIAGNSSAYLLLKTSEPLSAGSGFSYVCAGCAECCRNKRIPVYPFDVLRLARFLALGTGEFLAKFVEPADALLKHEKAGGCIFLEGTKCGVYEFRPLVCRLYPLRRHSSRERGEIYALAEPEPETKGRYGTAGSVSSFIKSGKADGLLSQVDRCLAARQCGGEPGGIKHLDVDRICRKHGT